MKSYISLLKILFISLSFTSFTANGADVVVNGSGLSGTYTTISAGINAANPGDRILVSNQSFPYQEDTIFINKDVTILPYNDIAHIQYEGQIKIILDSISNLTLIGFNSPNSTVWSQFNDTSRNSLSTINIIDSYFSNIYLDQPKTSFYLSHSTANLVVFTHGDIIANNITILKIGNFDCSYSNSNSSYNHCLQNFYYVGGSNQIGWSSGSMPSECELFSYYIPFGNISVYSDTCNIIANDITRFENINRDFPINFRNNQVTYLNFYLLASTSKGVNQIINNNIANPSYLYASYCSNTSNYNYSDITLNFLNNYNLNNHYLSIIAPTYINNAEYTISNLSPNKNSISSYNSQSFVGSNHFPPSSSAIVDSTFNIGPNTTNPSSEFLNLNLTLNVQGINGGSYAWGNIIGGPLPGFGSMTGSKARITYLNLPTQIFDPSNIRIKAKAVHGN